MEAMRTSRCMSFEFFVLGFGLEVDDMGRADSELDDLNIIRCEQVGVSRICLN